MKNPIKIIWQSAVEHTHVFEECPELDASGKATGYSAVICVECGTPKNWTTFHSGESETTQAFKDRLRSG